MNLTPAPSQQQTTSGAYHGGEFTQKCEEREREGVRNEQGDERVAVLNVLFYLVYITICHMLLCSNDCYLSYKCYK